MIHRRQVFQLMATGLACAAAVDNPEASAAASSGSGIIDTNVNLFRWPFRRLPLDQTETLVQKFRRLGIKQAWVGSFEGVFHRDVRAVNDRLVQECHRYPEFVPIGSVNVRVPAWERDVDRCFNDHQMPGVRLHPGYHGYTLQDPEFLRLLNLVTHAGGFVQIVAAIEDVRTQPSQMKVPNVDLTPLVDVMAQLQGARVQILGERIRPNVAMQFAKTGGIHFDTSRIDSTDGVPEIVEQLPRGRVLYGSGAPFLIPEASLIRTHESARLNEAQLQDLMSENAGRFSEHPLIKVVNDVGHHASGLPSVETLHSFRIWDSYFTPSFSHPGVGNERLYADIERAMPAIEKARFEKLVYFAHVGVGTTGDAALEKDLQNHPEQILTPLRRYPNRLLGMIQLNANNVQASLDAIDRWLLDGPMLGVYFPGGGPGAVVCTDRRVDRLVDRVHQRKGVIMQHTWFNTLGKPSAGSSTPSELAELARRFPEQTFLCAHAGGEWQQGIRAVSETSNVLVETSGFDAAAGFIEMAIKELGSDRIVFGSHLPSRSLGTELGKVIGANVTDPQRRQILGENFRRVLEPIMNR